MPEKEKDINKKNIQTGFNFQKLIKRFLKLLIAILLTTITLILIFIILFQFRFFRNFVVNTVLNEVNKSLIARIELDDITINPFKGIELYNFRLIAQSDTMVFIPHFFVSIDALSVLNNKIIIKTAELDNPQIKIFRSKDGTWTYDHIAKPTFDTIPSAPVELDIIIKHFRINDGSFTFIDSIEAPQKAKGNFAIFFNFKDIHFLSDAYLDLKVNRFYFDIKLLKYYEEFANFKLDELSGAIGFDNDFFAISNLLLKFEESDLTLNLYSTYPWLLFTDEDQQSKQSSYKISINSENLKSKDISKIYDISKFYNGNIGLKISGTGNKNNAYLESLTLSTNNTKINLSGKIENFNNPEKMKYEAQVKETRIYFKDLNKSMPQLADVNIPFNEGIEIKKLNITGNSYSIETEADINTEIGKFKVQAAINNFSAEEYKANLSVSNFNPSIFNFYNTIANFNADIRGKGFNIQNSESRLKVDISNSKIDNILINKGLISGELIKIGQIIIDTAILIFDSSMVYNKEFTQDTISKLSFKGIFDISNPKLPKYKFSLTANGVNISQISSDKEMPIALSGNFKVEGSGLVPDSLDAHIDIEITEALFRDKALFPFDFSIDISRQDSLLRNISIKSDFINLRLLGNFNFSNILSLLNNQGIYLSEYINKKINSVSPLEVDSLAKESITHKISHFAPLDLRIDANINNLYLLSPFVKGAKFDIQADLRMNLSVKEDSSILTIDNINISYLEYDNGRTRITMNPTQVSGNLLMSINDSLPYLNNLDLIAQSSNDIRVNENSVQNPKVFLKLFDDYLNFRLSGKVNEIIDFFTYGNFFFDKTNLDFTFDSISISYKDILNWHSSSPIEGSLNINGVKVQKLNLERENAEKISIIGNIDDQSIDSLKIEIDSLPINNIEQFLSISNSGLSAFNGTLDSLGILINGIWDSLRMDFGLRTSTLSWKNIKIGNILGKLTFQDNNLSGGLSLVNFENGTLNNLFSAHIKSFPLNLFPKGENTDIFFGEKPLKINIISNNLPINYISSFVREVENLKGSADLNVGITGFLPDRLNINGKLNIDPTSFLITMNNMMYSLYGDILINTDSIKINQLYLSNNPRDLENGKVLIKGDISLKDFSPEDFDITLESPGFKILSDASVKAMPELFGDIVISTGPNPIRIFGNTSKPTINGDINVLKANLNMPNIVAKQTLQSNIIYKINGKNLKIEYTNENRVSQNSNGNINNNKEFASTSGNLEIDLGIRIPNNIKLKMELGSIEELNAEISVPDRTTPLRFYIPRGSTQPKMTGDLIVREGSKLKIYKTFNTSGKISFPTGQIDNPTLDLRAEYNGKNTNDNKVREYKVILTVKGTKTYPIINFDYIIDGKQAIGDSSTITQDAIFLLIFGKTKTELFASEGFNSNITEDISRTGVSMYFSKFLSDLLGNSGFIQDTDIDFSSGSWEEATVKVSGQLGGATWKIGGNVSDFYYNNEFSIEFPLPLVLHPKFLNNIILQFTRSTNTATPTTKDQKEWEIRLKFGGSW